MQEGYNNHLANEWIDWVEKSNPEGTREQEIFPLIKSWIKKIKPERLVDIGCGQGSCSTLLNKKIEYIGTDSSPSLIKRAKKLYLEPNKKFIQGDANNIPIESESTDAIISVWVWSHLDNLQLTSQEMYRVLKPKGRFMIITANPETYEERKTFYKDYSIKGNLLRGTFNLGGGKFLSDSTLYLHTKEDIESSIRKSGLKINYIKRMGQAESSEKGLYLVIEGSK